MLTSIIPKLPSTNLSKTRALYIDKLKFVQVGGTYPDYLMVARDNVEIHFFLHLELDQLNNDGMCYVRVTEIEKLHQEFKSAVPGTRDLESKPWGQKEFSIVDDDYNCITFGESASS